MTSVAARVRTPRRLVRLVPLLVALTASLVALGPALGRGVVLTYDLAWSPDPRWTPFSLGVGTPAPRAVPSDAVGVLLGHLVGAGPAQALVLAGILVLAGWGAARLAAVLTDGSVSGQAAAALAGVWNPFVLERLVVGQWTVLLGYAAVPHLLLAARRARERPGWALLLGAGVAATGLGGANTVVLALLATLPVLLVPRPSWRPAVAVVLAALGSSAVWAVPGLLAGVRSAAGGAAAFAPRADTPFGAVVSLLSGGGFWNPATHPAARSSPALAALATLAAIAALVAAVTAARRRDAAVLLVPSGVGLLLAVLAVADPGGAWSAVVGQLPGAGLLRDAHKLVAPLVAVAAAGAGVLVAAVVRTRPVGPAAAVLLALVPVVALPSLAWGVGGRVSATQVPDDVRDAAALVSRSPDGVVGLLPWSQYRRYAWNDARVSLSLVPRTVDQRVLFDDGLPLRDGRVPGEDPAAARVTSAIATGTDPVAALAAEGARYVLVERRVGRAGAGADAAVPPGATVLADSVDVLLLDLGGVTPVAASSAAGSASPSGALTAGWLASLLTWGAAVAVVGHAAAVRRRSARDGRYRLVQSRP